MLKIQDYRPQPIERPSYDGHRSDYDQRRPDYDQQRPDYDQPRGDYDQGQWDVSLWLKNAFDKTYYTTLWTGGNGGYEGLLGTPRTLGVTGRYDF